VPAIWIAPALEDQAIAAGYSVVDAVTVITTHLGELIRQHAWELLGRAETKRLLDALNESHPKLLEELVPKLLTLGEVAGFWNSCCASGFRSAIWARFSRRCSRPRR
jgi:flagellar biosynthesis protein FlhA